MKYKYTVHFIFIMLIYNNINAQSNKWGMHAGYGVYEAFHVGVSNKIAKNNEILASIGYSYFPNNKHTFSSKIEDRYHFKFKSDYLQGIFINAKAIYWIYNDNYFEWKTITGSLGVGKRIELNINSALTIDLGASANFHLAHTRKNLEEAAWPRLFNFNACIAYQFYF